MKPFEIVIDHELYPKKAILDARVAFLEYMEIKLSPISSRSVKLIITINPQYNENKRQIYLEFFNYILDKSTQLLLERE